MGMALLEVLIAMVIFSFAVLGLVALQAKAVQFSTDSEDRTRAALLANELVSQMWTQQTTSTTDLSSQIATWKTQVANSAGAGLPNGEGSVNVDANGVATITVTWKAPWKKNEANGNKYSTLVVIP